MEEDGRKEMEEECRMEEEMERDGGIDGKNGGRMQDGGE